MNFSFAVRVAGVLSCASIMLGTLAGCNGGPGFAQPDGVLVSYTVGGSVSGLSASGLVLQNNGANNLAQNANGNFTFGIPLAGGASYAVTVLTQPVGQTCTVGNGSGSKISSNITNVSVTCSAVTYTVSGTVTGLNANQKIVIKNNGADPIDIGSNSTFTFATPISYGSSYAVTVATQPVTQTCTVTNGSLTNVNANVSNVAINCSASTYQVLYSYGTIANDALAPANGRLVQASDGYFYGTSATGGANGDGAIFKISPLGVESILYSFDSSGSGPYRPAGAGVVIGNDGNFYGITSRGGSDDCGAIYTVTPGGAFTMLHQFNFVTTDGCFPLSGLTLGTDGNFYGTTFAGGANNDGTVFVITPSGTETLLYSFGSFGGDGINPYNSDLVQASDGNFYGTTYQGGARGEGMVFKITPSGTESDFYDFGGGNHDGANPEATLTIGADGNFYGTTVAGGPANLGAAFKLTMTGVQSILHFFAGGTADGSQPFGSALTQGADGNFYSMTEAGGANGDGVLYRMTSSGAVTILRSFAGGTGDGATSQAGITIGTDGYLYGVTSAGGTFSEGVFFRY